MSNSKKKMRVGAKPMKEYGGKRWVYVELQHSKTFYPSFEDLFRMIQAIAYCEDEKYPPPAKGRRLVGEFLADAWKAGMTWETLAEKHKIPIRCGNKVINSNGAKLGDD